MSEEKCKTCGKNYEAAEMHLFGTVSTRHYRCCVCETKQSERPCCDSANAKATWRQVVDNERKKSAKRVVALSQASSLLAFAHNIESRKSATLSLVLKVSDNSDYDLDIEIPEAMRADFDRCVTRELLDMAYRLHRGQVKT